MVTAHASTGSARADFKLAFNPFALSLSKGGVRFVYARWF
jgi:hypothetical protein